MVGVPGRVVAREGRKVEEHPVTEIDLRHDLLPDPVAETLNCLKQKMESLEKKVRELEERTCAGGCSAAAQ